MTVAKDVRGLERRIASYGAERAVVAFSGGVDSAVVLASAARAMGADRTVAVTAVSPSYPGGELESARRTADALGVGHATVETGEVDREAYARNDAFRCFHCKTELFATLERIRGLGASESAVVLTGANADDMADVRPGLAAGGPFGVRNPLLEEGLGKERVRAVARHLELEVWDKPPMACLSSRVAFGIRITPELLGRIDAAERVVRSMGFDQVRVRHLGPRASIEVPSSEVARLMARLSAVAPRIRSLGWDRVDVDPGGYRPGAMNQTLIQVGGAAVRPDGIAAGSGSGPPGSRPPS